MLDFLIFVIFVKFSESILSVYFSKMASNPKFASVFFLQKMVQIVNWFLHFSA